MLYPVSANRFGSPTEAPIPRLADVTPSPDGHWIAFKPPKFLHNGYTDQAGMVIERTDGGDRWHLGSALPVAWMPNGDLVVQHPWSPRSQTRNHLWIVDPRTRASRRVPLSSSAIAAFIGATRVTLQRLVFSIDGRYLAVQVNPTWPQGKSKHRLTGVLLIRVMDWKPIRAVFTPYAISMIGWSPVSDSLAFSTSGFPLPHQMILIARPRAAPRVLLESAPHFDWFSWSPDGRWILVDNEEVGPRSGEWLVLSISDPSTRAVLPRFGGMPTWCCPVGPSAGA
jgi:hypothetical protein